jgi:alkylhydroperoxidase/carboxymuconolactone decarboxylase family protein YurZ
MSKEKLPKWYSSLSDEHPKFIQAVEELGKALKDEGPLDERTGHLIQLAAAAASFSQGAVHSHVRRALESGATPEEVQHAVILLTSTIGFPRVAAALSWVDDIIGS